MKLEDIYKSDKTIISFEIFPPENDEKLKELSEDLETLKKYNPKFISLTCGSAGKNNENYKKVLLALKKNMQIDIMPHFTCICNNKAFIDSNLDFLKELGTENILALRGDKPENYQSEDYEFRYANELVKYLREKTNFSIAVAGYPEGHIECESIDKDIENLKNKINSGASAIITQMFFENKKFFEYQEKLNKNGISVPLIAGIMPIISTKQIDKMIKLAKVTLPKKLSNKIELHKDDKDYIKKLGIEFASTQCEELKENKVKGLHFFTLNKAYSTTKILENIL